jgi:hypothetical protein
LLPFMCNGRDLFFSAIPLFLAPKTTDMTSGY